MTLLLPQIDDPARFAQSSSFSPSQLSPDLWFDFSDLSTMFQEITGASATTPASVGNPVGSIRNKGTLGGWATSPSTSNRATLTYGSSLYGLTFDGSSSYYTFSSYTVPSQSTFYFSFYRTSSTHTFGFNSNSNSGYTSWIKNNGEVYNYLGNFSDDTSNEPTYNQTAAAVVIDRRNSGNTLDTIRNNTKLLSAFADGSTARTINDIGYNSYTPGTYTSGIIYSVAAFPVAHTDGSQNLSNMTTWMGAKAGLSL